MPNTYRNTTLQFNIAGLPFRIKGKEQIITLLKRLDGFAPFLVKEETENGYTFLSDCQIESIHNNISDPDPAKQDRRELRNQTDRRNQTESDRDNLPRLLHQFSFENIDCYFYSIAKNGYQFEMIEQGGATPFIIRYDNGSNIIKATTTDSIIQLRFGLWMAYGLVAAAQKRIAIHSSVIVYDPASLQSGNHTHGSTEEMTPTLDTADHLQGTPDKPGNRLKAILFLGESGTGKSTHTRLWQENIPGCFLLNDDSPILQSAPSGKTIVYGSPWSGKTPCYKNQSCEVAAIVRLSQAPYNKIKKSSRLKSIGALLPSCPPSFAYDQDLQDCILKTLSGILLQTPVYHLACLPDKEAALTVAREIAAVSP